MSGKQKIHVRGLYDYDYVNTHGDKVSIRVGEEYIVLKKTSTEWWYVVKNVEKAESKEHRQAFYVPASYVEPIHRTVIALDDSAQQPSGSSVAAPAKAKKPPPRPPKPKTHLPKPTDEEQVLKEFDEMLDFEYQTLPYTQNLQNGGAQLSAFGASDKDGKASGASTPSSSSKNSLDKLANNGLDREVKLDTKIDANSNEELPDYANLAEIRTSLGVSLPEDAGPCYANLDELRDSLSSLPSHDPPTPGHDEVASADLGDGWGIYRDQQSNKQYYHNKDSKESSWRPPASAGGTKEQSPQLQRPQKLLHLNSFGTSIPLSSDSDDPDQVNKRLSSLSTRSSGGTPTGWRESVADTGDVFFVHDHTNETWQSSKDSLGRKYYFKRGSQGESHWELPQMPRIPSIDSALHRLGTRSASPNLTSTLPASTGSASTGSSFTGHPAPSVRASWAPGDHHHYHGNNSSSLTSSLGGKPHSKLVPKISTPQLSPTALRESNEDFESETISENAEKDKDEEEMSTSSRISVASLTANLSAGKATNSDNEKEEENEGGANDNEKNEEIVEKAKDLTPPAVKRPSEKKGILNKAKLSENGKKVNKKWSTSYVIATGSQVYMYKDQKAAVPKEKSPNGKPETIVDVQGATIELSKKNKSSKKNVIEVTTENGTEYLFQAQDTDLMNEWYKVLRNNAMHRIPSPSPLSYGGSQRSLNSTFEEGRSPKRDKRGNESPDDTLAGPAKNSKIRDRLMRWLFTRPSMGDLEKRGYIKDRVFGGHLTNLALRDGVTVPRFLTLCTAAIETRGLSQDGLYRVSGNLAQIQKLRFQVDSGEPYDLNNPEWEIHVLTGALKMFFRELREPVFPFNMFDPFINTISKLRERGKRLKEFKQLLKELPAPNRDTLRDLLQHLIKVEAHSSDNRMETQNLAIVFGPTLMWPEIESANIAVSMVYQGQIVEFLIKEYKQLF